MDVLTPIVLEKKKAQRGKIGGFCLYVYAMYYSMGIMNLLFICF